MCDFQYSKPSKTYIFLFEKQSIRYTKFKSVELLARDAVLMAWKILRLLAYVYILGIPVAAVVFVRVALAGRVVGWLALVGTCLWPLAAVAAIKIKWTDRQLRKYLGKGN